MKRIVLILTVTLLAIALTSAPVFAGSHGGGHHRGHYSGGARVSYGNYTTRATTVCYIESCTLSGQHAHKGTTYYAHYYGDGHAYHDYCNVRNCTIGGYHEHDGTYHFSHHANDGHGYHGGLHH